MSTTEESKERILSNHFFSVKNLTMDGMWVVLLFISGLFKIPSPIPGTEFQLSAPLAISIGRIRGFLHYLTIGIIASIIGMILGLQTIYNVINLLATLAIETPAKSNKEACVCLRP